MCRRGRGAWEVGLLFLVSLLVAGCQGPSARGEGRPRGASLRAGSGVARLRVQVLDRRPHDREAFTQGLLWHGGKLYESTGLRRRSSLRRVDLASGKVLQRKDLEPRFFGEGLAWARGELVQLTWTSGKALRWDPADFRLLGTFDYAGEGWGLCFDGQQLVMSDGSAWLTFRDPATFRPLRRVRVTLSGRPVRRLNELECVEGSVYANVWTTDRIVRIDPDSGRVTALVDASGLLGEQERRGADVLNGIAWVPETERFLLTGKNWPWLFEVRFVDAEGRWQGP